MPTAPRRLGLAILLALRLAAAPLVLDAIVATIDRSPIAATTLEAFRARYAADEPPGVALQRLIDDRLVVREARRYALELPAGKLEAALKASPPPPGFTRPEWAGIVADHLLARQFLAFRFGEFVSMTRNQVRTFYTEHRDRFPGPFDREEPAVRDALRPIVQGQREQEFLVELRRRSDVVIFPDRMEVHR